uniref:Phosphatase and actin regulator n=1 Tax=Bursaphelenchus xylophilus TaxID=6326 RepID=A0A1I7RJA9_BURXY
MTDVTAQLYQMEPFNSFSLDPTLRQIRDILKVNELSLTAKEKELLRQLEERLPLFCGPKDTDDAENPEQKAIKTENRPKEPGFPVLSHVS